jgi:hypothetical protein
MNVRARFMAGFFAICIACSMVSMASILLLPQEPMMRWVPAASFIAAFAGVYLLLRHYRSRLPAPTTEQRLRAIRANRRLAWIYLGGLAFGLISEGKELFAIPHGVGFLLPLIPIGLAAIHFRNAAQLSRKATEAANAAARDQASLAATEQGTDR